MTFRSHFSFKLQGFKFQVKRTQHLKLWNVKLETDVTFQTMILKISVCTAPPVTCTPPLASM
jgi:hypothetical protein